MKAVKPISRDTVAEIRASFNGHFEYGSNCDGACEQMAHEWTRTLLAYAEQMNTVEDVLRGVAEACTRALVNATVDDLPQEETEGLDRATRQALQRYLTRCLRRWEKAYLTQRDIGPPYGPPINE